MDNKKNKDKKNKNLKYYIIGAIVAVIVIAGIGAKLYINSAMEPVDSHSKTAITIKIPSGATNKKIGQILEENKVIKSSLVFDYYVKTSNKSGFQAGYYSLTKSMSLKQITAALKKGGSDTATTTTKGKVLVQEGETADQIAASVAKQTKYSAKDFLALLNDDDYLNSLVEKYPELLTSAMSAQNVRYRLEGYLFPATYDVSNVKSLKALVTQMVDATNTQMKPYYNTINKRHMSVQEVLTLASLAEREGVTTKDREKIVGVFFNRIAKNMPLQSDISVMYALSTHKKNLTYKDLKVDSPYNLYTNTGYGPGPFNSPGLDSIKAVLNPKDQSKGYLYFVANMKTGKVYYSKTYEQHQKITAKLSKDNE